ncbi:hypothetical protein VT84_08150 [Gemmata sp. SH-PL17]|uniref:DUF5678 domain-containing protein n=1 Tax=Gemmata sp. SH-PL17 TaxID=1630693 RepID=UPI0004ACA35F|nr:DUF5678 domain-containing protein [Gemmata sp. SH-PL17]AMV24353.1 hypothetical protein VT84_08150 [Gemmata sp. SH-PL17]
MPTPNSPTPTIAPPAPTGWSEADLHALVASDFWYHTVAPRELILQYRGKHVAIFGEQIVDADSDFDELARRLNTKSDAIPFNRLLLRYVPTDEETVRFRY